MRDRSRIKSAYLEYLNYSLAKHESADQAFDRLHKENPDLFPVPRYYESFMDACADCLRQVGLL